MVIRKTQLKSKLAIKSAVKSHHVAYIRHMMAKTTACKTKKCRANTIAKLHKVQKFVKNMHKRINKFKANRARMSRKQVAIIKRNTLKFKKMQAKRTKFIERMI